MQRITSILFGALFFVVVSAPAEETREIKWHFALSAAASKGDVIDAVLTAPIPAGSLVYSSDFKADIGPQPTVLLFEPNDSFELVGAVVSVGAKRKKDRTWDTELGYFEGRAELRQKIRVIKASPIITGRISGQLCNETEGTCVLFEEKFPQ